MTMVSQSEVSCRVTQRVRGCIQARLQDRPRRTPSTTLTYAQSLDGSIAVLPGRSLQISNAQSLTMTHRLRACHDAVLVGINTVLTDDPRLTVRLVPGRNPQPVVLDGDLRFPPSARLLREPCVPPLIFTGMHACSRAEARLRAAGASVIRVPTRGDGMLNLLAVVEHLGDRGLTSLMVEGGARVITSFLKGRLADQVVLTISPQFVGGLRGVKRTRKWAHHPLRLADVAYETYDGDVVVFGLLREQRAAADESELETSRPGTSLTGAMRTIKK